MEAEMYSEKYLYFLTVSIETFIVYDVNFINRRVFFLSNIHLSATVE